MSLQHRGYIPSISIYSESVYLWRCDWQLSRSSWTEKEKKEKKKRTSGCCSTHVVDRKYAGEAGRWGVAGEQERWWPPLSPAIIRQDSPEEVRNHHHIWSVLPFSFEVLFKKIKNKKFSKCGNSSQSPQLVSAWHAVCIMVCLCTSNYK